MARKRMIDPSIWADESFGRLSALAKVMFIGMISNADDEGRLPADPTFLSSSIFPFLGMSKGKSEKILKEIEEKMKSLTFYCVSSEKLAQFEKWHIYQSINKPTKSKYPQPQVKGKNTETLLEDSSITTVGLPPNRIEENRNKNFELKPPSGDKEFEKEAWDAAIEATSISGRRLLK